MRATRLLILVLTALALPVSADKLTVDPNAPGNEPAKEAVQAKDARLEQKITYYSGNKRLHAVADELSAMTGVLIRCGSSSKDWQVRDIPVVVCANDLPLGTVLKTLAEATHVSLHTERPEEKNAELRYRLVRDKKTRDEMDAFFEARRKQALAESDWAWDVLTRIGSMSDDDLKKLLAREPEAASAVPMAKLAAALGPEAKDKLFAGEQISLDGMNSPEAALVKAYFAHLSQRFPASITVSSDSAPEPWSPGDLESLRTSFRFTDTGDEPSGITVTTSAFRSHNGIITTSGIGSDLYPLYKLAGSELPPRPKAQQLADGPQSPDGFDSLRDDAQPLSTKAKIEKPMDAGKPTFADAVTAISKASGISIIVEDFDSHKLSRSDLQCPSAYGDNAPISAFRSMWSTRWFGSEDGRLVVGWASEWQKSHANLMPESVLEEMRAKLKGAGVTLDDFAALVLWNRRQRQEWFDREGDLAPLADIFVDARSVAIWQLYATLSPQDKALAQTETGLSFAKFDPQWLSGFLRDAMRNSGDPGYDFGPDESRSRTTTMTDPRLVGGLTLTIKPQPDPSTSATRYNVTLSGENEGEKFSIFISGSQKPFPIKLPPKAGTESTAH